jgi:hypothetical protein
MKKFINLQAMFGPFEDDYEEEQENRKNRREFNRLYYFNCKMKKQIESK